MVLSLKTPSKCKTFERIVTLVGGIVSLVEDQVTLVGVLVALAGFLAALAKFSRIRNSNTNGVSLDNVSGLHKTSKMDCDSFFQC
jgi:hypothetical protein